MKIFITYFRRNLDHLLDLIFKRLWKFIPVVLLIAFLFTFADFNFLRKYIYANVETVNVLEEDIDLSKIKNAYEVEELRTENSKTFKKVNNSYELVLFNNDVHYLKDGKYHEIDNTLILKSNRITNTANIYKVDFPKNIQGNKSSMTYLNNTIQWEFLNTNRSTGKIYQENKIKYNNVYDDVNIEYVVLSNRIKENIELIKYTENFSFSYKLTTDLKLIRNENDISFYDNSDKPIFKLNDYYMFDSNNKYSFDFNVEIEQINTNEYYVTVNPSDVYLKNASYPVIIDPEIVINYYNQANGSIEYKLFNEYGMFDQEPNNILDLNSKLFYRLNFKATSAMSQLKNSNILYSYFEAETNSTSCTTGECTVSAKKVDNTTWNYINEYTNGTDIISSIKFSNNSSFYHRFDIYDYMYNNIYKLGTNFDLIIELVLSGGTNSYVDYRGPGDDQTSVVIGYSDISGLYDYYTYEEMPSSNSSTSYIAHNSGNLTSIFNIFSDDHLINLAHIYNSNKSHVLGNYGYGFRLNYEESINEISTAIKRLTKGDGSIVDFYLVDYENYYYVAMDGSGDELIGWTGYYTIKTKDNVEKLFNYDNKLYKIYPDTDDRTKYVSISYDSSKRISSIQDYDTLTAKYNTKINLYYNSSNLLSYIYIVRKNQNSVDSSVQYTSFTYSNYRLTCINKYSYLHSTYFETTNMTYNGTTNYLLTIKDNLTNGLRFNFNNSNRIVKVSMVVPNVYEINSPYLNFEYNNNGRKVSVIDQDNLKVTYTFDKYFHTKTVTNSLGYTSFTEYADIYYTNGVVNPNPNYHMNHKVTVSSQPFKNNVNLINNHGFEHSDILRYWYTGSGYATVDKINALYGSRALCLKNSSTYANIYQTIRVIAGKEYTVTGYIKNTNNNGNGAYIEVYNPNITILSNSEPIINSQNYKLFTIKFRANSTTNLSINLYNESIGNAYFDSIQVNETTLDIRYNLMQNSSFEFATSGWTNLLSSEIVDNSLLGLDHLGFYCSKFRGKTISQYMYLPGNAGDVYVFGGSALLQNVNSNGKVRLKFTYTDYTNEVFEFSYDPNDSNLQYIMKKAIASKPYTSITLEIQNTSTNDYLYIDNLSLYKEGYGVSVEYYYGTSVNQYYSDQYYGNIKGLKDEITGSSSTYTYESNGNIDTITENNVNTDVNYQNNKDWVNNVTRNNISQNYSRDTNGNITTLSLKNNGDNKLQFSSSTAYTPDKLYVLSKVDQYERITSYTYNYLTGLLDSSTYNNVTTSNTYNALKLLTSETKGSKTITYGYTGKMLTSITVDGLIYSFEYNQYYDITAIKIAGVTILSHTYKMNDRGTPSNTSDDIYSGLINSTTYGTDIISFTYDSEKRIKEVLLNNVKLIEYFYDSLGNISSYIDYKTNTTYYYNYDAQNRLVKINSSDGNNVVYEYNSNGFLSKKTNNNGSTIYDYTSIDGTNPSGKNENMVLSSEQNQGIFTKYYNYKSKALNKLDNIAITTNTSSIISSYVYDSFTKSLDGVPNQYETLRIKELHIKKSGSTTNLIDFYYTYDNFDNIETIDRYDDGNYTQYEFFGYNNLNQLTSHVIWDGSECYDTYYTYDDRGNVTLIEKVDSYSTSVISLSYRLTGWKDQLLSVTIDGVSYLIGNYDIIGNPLTYFGYTIEYNQRAITKLTNGSNVYQYSYNASGIRTSKNINGLITNYVLDGNKIIQENRTGVAIKYYYDNNNEIIGFTYNGAVYTYIKNLQNDIIGIADVNGNIVVKYFYDAYGILLSQYDNSGFGLANINPFRFKSYYYDRETKFYYLNSRFYDPLIGRFINADDVNLIFTGETNLYNYCNNNPIMRYDPDGYFWWIIPIVALLLLSGCSDTPNYGSASAYNHVKGGKDSINCYAYAIGYHEAVNPGGISGTSAKFNDVYSVENAVKKDLEFLGRSARRISGPKGKIEPYEYRIALRVGTRPYARNQNTYFYDYHFMVQNSDGRWAEKHGQCDSIRNSAGKTPNNLPWDLGEWKNYYDSKIIYLAISK